MVLNVISTGVDPDDLAGRLRLREVIGQEERRRLVTQPRHDQLPQVAVVAVEPDPLIDVLDRTSLPLGLRDLTASPTLRGQASDACQHAATASTDGDESDLVLIQLVETGIGGRARVEEQTRRVVS